MEKKKRVFYIEFIRVISMIIIVTYHFFVHFAENNIKGIDITNGTWGVIGVTLFFMISGASLMYNYKEKLEIKTYAKKRFLGIYPMFWIAYSLLFIYLFYECKSIIDGQPAYKLIISFLGMDGYLSPYISTIYLIGEWFLGCIVIIYILFPILRILVNKNPKTTLIFATILYILMFIFYKNGKMPIDKTLIVSIYSVLIGMYIIKVKEFKLWQAIIALIITISTYIVCSSNNFVVNIQVFIAKLTAFGMFVVLAYIGQKISNITIQKIFSIISKYSYAIFLVHHYLIMKIESTFQNQTYGLSGTVLLYLTCWVAIIIFARILFYINKKVINFFKKDENILKLNESKEKREEICNEK